MNEKFPADARKIMKERFQKDTLLALATTDGITPYVRVVNGYYEDNAFYVITHACSAKMDQIRRNPSVSICGEWFTAHGSGINLGYFGKKENQLLAEKLKNAFASWIDNGHNDFEDQNTCILCIQLTKGVLFSHGTRYQIDFTKDS
ncbi:MAG: pyridoxamine 5'-phosphate oxidase family protein [Clostridiales bacterium]|nr:pyridoxamine 5'-phosphate oxidase family protein [Clostridiales bacterium]